MLPDGNGLDFLRELRAAGNRLPTIMLTAWNKNRDIALGLAAGANDYLGKPFDYDVLLARLAAMFRNVEEVPDVLKRGPLKLDIVGGVAWLNGQDMLLTQKEFALLLLFVRHEGRPLSAEYLYEKVWRQYAGGGKGALKNMVYKLRKKLEAAPDALTQGTPKDVVFTFTQNDFPVQSGTPVTFDNNPNFKGLPQGEVRTGSNGQVTVNGLTVLASGVQTITATIDSQIVGVSISVTAGTYKLEASPSTMKQGEAKEVLFTFTVNGTPLPNKPVTFAANGSFENLPTTTVTTDTNGEIVISDLTVTAYTNQKINATIDGQSVDVDITVTAIVFSRQ